MGTESIQSLGRDPSSDARNKTGKTMHERKKPKVPKISCTVQYYLSEFSSAFLYAVVSIRGKEMQNLLFLY